MELKKAEVLLEDEAPGVLGNAAPVFEFEGTSYGHHVSTFVPFYQDDNLHHGRFFFRHKGKRKKGKPN